MKRVTFRAKAPPLSTRSFGANRKRASCQEPPAKITYSEIETQISEISQCLETIVLLHSTCSVWERIRSKHDLHVRNPGVYLGSLNLLAKSRERNAKPVQPTPVIRQAKMAWRAIARGMDERWGGMTFVLLDAVDINT